jgi:hypothetical protein
MNGLITLGAEFHDGFSLGAEREIAEAHFPALQIWRRALA